MMHKKTLFGIGFSLLACVAQQPNACASDHMEDLRASTGARSCEFDQGFLDMFAELSRTPLVNAPRSLSLSEVTLLEEMQQKWEGFFTNFAILRGQNLEADKKQDIRLQIAALCEQDLTRMQEGAHIYQVLEDAQNRFAREQGVPVSDASSFTRFMGRMSLHESLLTLAKNAFIQEHSSAFLDTYDVDALKTFLMNRAYVWPETFRSNKRCSFFEKFSASRSFEETANAMLEGRVSEALLGALPLPLKLRATALLKTPLNLEEVLTRVGKMEETRALALMFLLKNYHRLHKALFQAEPSFSTPYLEMLVHDVSYTFPVLTNSKVLPLVLKCDGLSSEEMSVFQSRLPADRSEKKTYAHSFFSECFERRQAYLKHVTQTGLLLGALENEAVDKDGNT